MIPVSPDGQYIPFAFTIRETWLHAIKYPGKRDKPLPRMLLSDTISVFSHAGCGTSTRHETEGRNLQAQKFRADHFHDLIGARENGRDPYIAPSPAEGTFFLELAHVAEQIKSAIGQSVGEIRAVIF